MNSGIANVLFQEEFHVYDIPNLSQEEAVNSADVGDFVHAGAQTHELSDGVNSVIGADGDVRHQAVLCPVVKFLHVQMHNTNFQSTYTVSGGMYRFGGHGGNRKCCRSCRRNRNRSSS